MTRPRTARIALALALLLGAAACGSDDPEPAGESGTTSTTEAEATEPTDADEPTDAEEPEDGTEPDDGPEATGDLSGVLLTADDLGEGWLESEDADDEDEPLFSSFDDDESCTDEPNPTTPDPVEELQVTFETATELEVVTAAAEFEEGAAAEWMGTVFDQLQVCVAAEGAPEEGQTYAVEPIEGLGDEAFAMTVEATREGEPWLAFGIAVARVGDRIVAVGSEGEASDDVDEEVLLRTMVDRL